MIYIHVRENGMAFCSKIIGKGDITIINIKTAVYVLYFSFAKAYIKKAAAIKNNIPIGI